MSRYRVPSANPIPLRLKEIDSQLRRALSATGATYAPVPLYQSTHLDTVDQGWHQILAGTAVGPGVWQVTVNTSGTAGAWLRLVVNGSAAPQVAAGFAMVLTAQLPTNATLPTVVALEGALMSAGPMTVTVFDSRTVRVSA